MDMCLQKEISPRVRTGLLRRLVSDARGSELFEFAMVLPVLVMLLMGMIWMGRAVSVYQALGRAAREGARVALAPTCATCGDSNNYGAASTAANNALTAASLDAASATVTVTPVATLNPGDPANFRTSGVTVTVQYPVQMNIPFTPQNLTTINLTSTVTMRQEF
jgi:Flp pilus assembly protein TadG